MVIRKLVYAMGYRYRLHARNLPGKPDLAFRKLRKVIFVHGCFWHRHANCALARLPKSRLDFWVPKLEGNRIRDSQTKKRLQKMRWKTLTIWECEVDNLGKVEAKIRRFLDA